jgi:hypothetical protein
MSLSFSLSPIRLLARSKQVAMSEEDYIPLFETRPRKSRWKLPKLARGVPSLPTLLLAVLAGALLCFALSSLNLRRNAFQLPFTPQSASDHHDCAAPLPPAEPTLQELRSIVARSNGYYARDYSLHLGWNNVSPPHSTPRPHPSSSPQMRYIIETALLHGVLLNRTVILPSFVYARSCEYDV